MSSAEDEFQGDLDKMGADFMTKELGIKDQSFIDECLPEIKKQLRDEFKKMHGKIASTYRKNLSDCKLWFVAASLAILSFPNHDAVTKTDYAKQKDMGRDFAVPERATLVECLLKKSPTTCTEEDLSAVAFFYKVALTTVEGKVLKSNALLERNDVWGALSLAFRWSASMAYSLMLVEKMSDLTNITHNYQLKQNKGGSSEEGQETTSGGEEREGGARLLAVRKMKKKIRVKESINGIVRAFYANRKTFEEARTTKEDKGEVAALRRRLRDWEMKLGIIGKNGASAAQKRRSVEPLQEATSKLPRMMDQDFLARENMMNNYKEDMDDGEDWNYMINNVTAAAAI